MQDYYALTWPDCLPSANYNLEIGLFPRFSDKGLLVNNGTANWTSITAREFGTTPANLRSMARSMTSKQLLYGDEYWLLGIDISREVFVSSTTKVDLMSMCSNQLTRSLIPQFFWATDNGTDFIPAAVYEQSTGKRTTGNLLCNQQAEMRRYNINTPAIPGNYSLVLGLLNAQDDVLPARCQWLGWTQTSCSIARVTVIPQNSGIANYNNTLLLVDTAMDIGGIPAGGPLSVSMQWRGLRSMDKDYTMFLQVIGPDGKIYGQVDSWPQQGGRPTSGWRIGEEIHDVYSVYIQEGAPPGQYNIILGWYLLADMRRIPVITGAGEIVNDFYELGSFTLLTDSDVE